MRVVFRLRKDLVERFRRPYGPLFDDPKELKLFLLEQRPPKLIAVGDWSTSLLARLGIQPDLSIVDGRIRRKKVRLRLPRVELLLRARNPPGMVTSEAWNRVKKALASKASVRIRVDGEEDLLVMPCVEFSPLGSIILYGLKGKICALRVDSSKKELVRELLSA
jgi:hypothetical protein